MEPIVHCRLCGEEEELRPGFGLPETGGILHVEDDRVVEYVCGPCWVEMPKPPFEPRGPDPDLIAKERRELQRQAEQRVWEWDQEFPGWRFARAGRREHL